MRQKEEIFRQPLALIQGQWRGVMCANGLQGVTVGVIGAAGGTVASTDLPVKFSVKQPIATSPPLPPVVVG